MYNTVCNMTIPNRHYLYYSRSLQWVWILLGLINVLNWTHNFLVGMQYHRQVFCCCYISWSKKLSMMMVQLQNHQVYIICLLTFDLRLRIYISYVYSAEKNFHYLLIILYWILLNIFFRVLMQYHCSILCPGLVVRGKTFRGMTDTPFINVLLDDGVVMPPRCYNT